MSQINPFRGLVDPSTRPLRVRSKKDPQQGSRQQRHPHEEAEEKAPAPPDDGKPHVDLKA